MVMRLFFAFMLALALPAGAGAQTRPRARDLGVPLEGATGPLNAITDVAGVEVGHKTLISGESVRTGVTAVWPRGKKSNDPVFGGFFSQNGNGDMTGTHWLQESGFLDGPVLITNTHSVGVVRDAFLGWLVRIGGLPVGEDLTANPPRAGVQWPYREDVGSIIIVVATDAPLLPHQVQRLARRATMGLARTGSISGNQSGDIFIAFSTSN